MWGKHCRFSHKTLWIATVSLHTVFFSWFFQNCFCQFYFFNIELVENYNYKSLQIRLNHVGKYCKFHHKTLWIAIVFPTWFFFPVFLYFFSKIFYVETLWIAIVFLKMVFFMIFSKIIFVDFIGESTVVFLTKHCQLLQYFFSWVFFLSKLSLSIVF